MGLGKGGKGGRGGNRMLDENEDDDDKDGKEGDKKDDDDDDDDDDENRRRKGLPKRNKYVKMLMDMAAKFDNQAEYLLDQNMCTDVCPCFQTEMWKVENGMKLYRTDPESEYSRLDE
jgi:hypothetical protein